MDIQPVQREFSALHNKRVIVAEGRGSAISLGILRIGHTFVCRHRQKLSYNSCATTFVSKQPWTSRGFNAHMFNTFKHWLALLLHFASVDSTVRFSIGVLEDR